MHLASILFKSKSLLQTEHSKIKQTRLMKLLEHDDRTSKVNSQNRLWWHMLLTDVGDKCWWRFSQNKLMINEDKNLSDKNRACWWHYFWCCWRRSFSHQQILSPTSSKVILYRKNYIISSLEKSANLANYSFRTLENIVIFSR